jgi:hypothetical protein
MATEPTVLTGKVANGVVILEEPEALPDGTVVRVTPVGTESTLGQRLLRFAGTIEGLPPNMARSHDPYIHGTSKKPVWKLRRAIPVAWRQCRNATSSRMAVPTCAATTVSSSSMLAKHRNVVDHSGR